ncbi:peptide chain release factor N(5)-glutamine methyltransferase [Lactobacillus corticis]|uniref:peptide chain release factor N(5)-glutamine methyltransferase n=1 Tax=Lactobacillus corticis TaxID=2201249 RepID=A0A916QIQ2_9LACO|nr:peptide chain release factor N(5)-glutamine methyltransferase [Lactobacillus corticis]GFZ27113.1 N5-glutamine S-adenosyl-L-methionine-dependent methyltransferase [Lactobacillus corticis]
MPRTIHEARMWACETADNVRPEDVDYLLAERLDMTPSQFQLKQDLVLTEEQEHQLKLDVKKLKRGVSPQYILGYSWFYGYKLKVVRGVLIPRFETEELVSWALDHVKNGDKVLDLGTGSGCITVAFGQEAAKKGIKDLDLYASDISDTALRTAEENFADYDLDVIVRKANILIGLEKFDKIISNPPYIKENERGYMDQNVLENEPQEALFGGKDGLAFYRRFADQVRDHLHAGGEFFLEYGFSEQDELRQLFAEKLPDFTVEFRNDLAGKPRMVYGKWNQ